MSDFPKWWQGVEIEIWRSRNPWFARCSWWMNPEAIMPADSPIKQASARQAFESLAWLYECHAMLEDDHIFNDPLCELGQHGLEAIFSAADPINGVSERWKGVLREEPGYALATQGDSMGGGPFVTGFNGFTPWFFIGDKKTKYATKKAISLNLFQSNAAIEKAMSTELKKLGLNLSRERIRNIITRKREELSCPTPSSAPVAGERRAAVPWEWLAPLQRAIEADKVVDLRYATRISDAKRIYREASAIIEFWEKEAPFVIEMEARELSRKPV